MTNSESSEVEFEVRDEIYLRCKRKNLFDNNCPGCENDPSCLGNIKNKIRKSDLEEHEINELCSALESFSKYNYKDIICDRKILSKIQAFGWNINNWHRYGPRLFDRACEMDDLERVNLLIEHGLNLEIHGKHGLTCACKNSSYKTFERLRSLNVKLDPNLLITTIEMISMKMLEISVENGADVNAINESNGKRPIHIAAFNGFFEKIQFLIKHGADFDAVDNYGDTFIHYAAICDENPSFIKKLYEAGFNFRAKNKNNRTPLMTAVKAGNEAVAKYLIKTLGDINDTDIYGFTALHFAACLPNPALLKFLLRKGANVNARSFDGATPLHFVNSVKWYYSDIKVRLLLDHGADIHAKDKFGWAPYYYLHGRLNEKLKKRFIKAGSDLRECDTRPEWERYYDNKK